MKNYDKEVTDAASAREFLTWCIREIGPGFHPDTEFRHYTNGSAVVLFTGANADRLDKLMGKVFDFLADPYEEGMKIMKFPEIAKLREKFQHDDCPECGGESVPAEGIPDQTLRVCPKCECDWFEDLSQPVQTGKL